MVRFSCQWYIKLEESALAHKLYNLWILLTQIGNQALKASVSESPTIHSILLQVLYTYHLNPTVLQGGHCHPHLTDQFKWEICWPTQSHAIWGHVTIPHESHMCLAKLRKCSKPHWQEANNILRWHRVALSRLDAAHWFSACYTSIACYVIQSSPENRKKGKQKERSTCI